MLRSASEAIPRTRRYAWSLIPALLLLLAPVACVDSNGGPFAPGGGASLAVAPEFSAHEGPSGTVEALRRAFERVDRFRLVVRRPGGGGVVVEVEIRVEPGQSEYDLEAEVPLRQSPEEFEVVVEAWEGEVALFRSDPVVVQLVAAGVEGAPDTPVPLAMSYTGPGAEAVSLEVAPEGTVLAPGGSAVLEATVLDEGGAVAEGVALGWRSEAPGVATVTDEGQVQGVGEGAARVVATTPTGLEAEAWVYVSRGEVSFVRDGRLWRAGVADDAVTEEAPGVTGVGAPAWSPDGSTLYFSEGGRVHQAGGGPVVGGSWPSISPDGTKVVVERGGQAIFVNDDGSNSTPGPEGRTPVWDPDGARLVVNDGAVARVRADGRDRTVMASGEDARWPAAAPDGRVAYVRGGGVYVRAPGADGATSEVVPPEWGVTSRPAWSATGRWLVVAAEGVLHLVPGDGSGPPAPLPAGAGEEPAWRGSGMATSPPGVTVGEVSPARPAVGDTISVSGSGFDWIIPANTRVIFPGTEAADPAGAPAPGSDEATSGPAASGAPVPGKSSIQGTVLSVGAGTITVVVPEGVGRGELRVHTRSGSAARAFTPAPARLEVTARTTSDHPVEGVQLRLESGDGETVASAVTGAGGDALLDDLEAGRFQLHAGAPDGFSLVGESPRGVELSYGTTTVAEITFDAQVVDFRLDPDAPRLEVGESVELTAEGIDALGNPVTEVESSRWEALISRIGLSGSGLRGTLTGVHPSREEGDAPFRVQIDDVRERFAATVTSHIAGRVLGPDNQPRSGTSVRLTKGGQEVASASTDDAGRYRFSGLFSGGYTVRISVPQGLIARPGSSQSVTLGEASPTGTANFRLVEPAPPEPEGDGDIYVINDWNIWDSGRNPPRLVQNLVNSANNEGTKVIWYCGHQPSSVKSGTLMSGGICNVSIGSNGSGQFGGTAAAIRDAGYTLEVVDDTPLTSIPDDVRVFWLWTPTTPLSDAEVNVLKEFAARGGRLVWSADYHEQWYFSEFHENIATRLLTQLGTGITSVGTLVTSTPTIVQPDDPLFEGITSVSFGFPGTVAVSPPGISLVEANGEVLIAWAPVDVTPLSSSQTAAPEFQLLRDGSATPPAAPTPESCVPGTVCEGEDAGIGASAADAEASPAGDSGPNP